MPIYDITRFPATIELGHDGENNWRPQTFDCSALLKNHPNGTLTLWVLPDGENQAFPVAVVRDGNNIIWTPLNEEMTSEYGQLQISCIDGTDEGKSDTVQFHVKESLVPGADHPESTPSWATQTVASVTEAQKHYPKIEDGTWRVWDTAKAEWVDTGYSADGKSAYQLAVEHGYDGSETEWLASLKGERGDSIVDAEYDPETKTLTLIPGMPNVRNYVSPEMFGAVGDGVTDDTAAVRRTMQEPFVILKGTYKVTSAITALSQVVIGNGSAKILASGDCLTFSNSVYLSDFAVETPYQTDGIAIRAQKGIVAERLVITGGRIGIQSEGVYYKNIIRSCTFKNLWGDSAAAVNVLFAGITEFAGNYVENVSNDLDRDADGVRFWQSKTDKHAVVRVVGNEFHNCRGRCIKMQTVHCYVADNFCHNDVDYETIPYCNAIDVQSGNSEVVNNQIVFPACINLSVRAGSDGFHRVEGNHLKRIQRETAGNYSAISVTDYAESSGVSVDVTITGNDIHNWSDKVPIRLPYVANAVYRLLDNTIFDRTYYSVDITGTEDLTCRFEMLGNTVAGYAYFCRFAGSMPNVKGDRAVICTTALSIKDVLPNTSFVAKTSDLSPFGNNAFLETFGTVAANMISITNQSYSALYERSTEEQIFLAGAIRERTLSQIPLPTSADNGKTLTVVNGRYALV